MKAIQITEFGGPEVLRYVDVETPQPSPSQELIEVTAIGINYADTHATENSYLSPQTLPLIPGMELVGLTQAGRRVLTVANGAYAQYAAAESAMLIDIPDAITDGQALAMMVQGSTAFHILKTMGHVQPGETVVIHAAAGGVGVIAIQLAKLWGAKVIAVVSNSQEKIDLVTQLGADVVVPAESENLGAALRAANGGKRIDLVLEMVGGRTYEESLKVLAPFGRLVTYGTASRIPPRGVTSGELVHGSKTVAGFWLAHCFGRKELLQDVIAELFEMIAKGTLRTIIGATYPLSQAKQAHEDMLARRTRGKLVLDPKL